MATVSAGRNRRPWTSGTLAAVASTAAISAAAERETHGAGPHARDPRAARGRKAARRPHPTRAGRRWRARLAYGGAQLPLSDFLSETDELVHRPSQTALPTTRPSDPRPAARSSLPAALELGCQPLEGLAPTRHVTAVESVASKREGPLDRGEVCGKPQGALSADDRASERATSQPAPRASRAAPAIRSQPRTSGETEYVTGGAAKAATSGVSLWIRSAVSREWTTSVGQRASVAARAHRRGSSPSPSPSGARSARSGSCRPAPPAPWRECRRP